MIYLDSAASSQTPAVVVDAMVDYYQNYRANVHRGAYAWSAKATDAYEAARAKVARFINAPKPEHCIFTRGTTESMNLLASTLGRNLTADDTIAVTVMEHHSNLVPWQQTGAKIEWIEVTEGGLLDQDSLRKALDAKPKIVATTWVSNVFGTINPIAQIREMTDALLVVDGAQGVPHLPTDVVALGADFLAFSGHKMCGPTGIGVLWGKAEHIEKLPPYQYGGSMISLVTRPETHWADLPMRLEAGTPAIAEAIGLGAAVDYLSAKGMQNVRAHEKALLRYALDTLTDIQIYGPRDPELQSGVLSFEVPGVHPHDVATILDRRGICVRAGHHCCQPLMRSLSTQRAPKALVRASFYIDNTTEDVDALQAGLDEARKIFRSHG